MENRLWSSSLAPGAILKNHIVTRDGQILLAKGTRMTITHIHILRSYDMYWFDEEQERKGNNNSFYNKFKHSYQTTMKVVRTIFNSADVAHKLQENDIRQIIKVTIKPLVETKGIIDYLHTIRRQDEYTLHHSVNVSILSGVMAKWMNYSETEIKDVMLAGLLHDIGKVKIPRKILNKPGSLDIKEMEIIRQHPVAGYEILKNNKYPDEVLLGILQHHEKLDGTGYPYNLKDDEIGSFSRIIAIVDIYDAMTSNRVYHKARTPLEVATALYDEMFGQLDPTMCMVFLNNIRASIIGCEVELSDGRIAQVIRLGQCPYSQPIVKTHDGDIIDLDINRAITIVKLMYS